MSTIVSISHVRQYHNSTKLVKTIEGTYICIVPHIILKKCSEHYLIKYSSGVTNIFRSYADLPKTAKNIVRGREWENYSHKMDETRGTMYTTRISTYERLTK